MFTIILRALRNNALRVKLFIVIFFTVGIVAIYIPYSSAFFVSLTPFALLLSFFFLLVFHKNFNLKYWFFGGNDRNEYRINFWVLQIWKNLRIATLEYAVDDRHELGIGDLSDGKYCKQTET